MSTISRSIAQNHHQSQAVQYCSTVVTITSKVNGKTGILTHCRSETSENFITKIVHFSVTSIFLGIVIRSTGWPKKVNHKVLSISLSNIDQLSKFFHWRILWKICNKVVTKHTTTP